MTELEQKEVFEIKTHCDEFQSDSGSAYTKYHAKHFEVTGVVKQQDPVFTTNINRASDNVDGGCHELCIFSNNDIYDEVSVENTATVKANFLVMTNWCTVM